MPCPDAERIADLSRAIRESTIKRFRSVPEGKENWRPVGSAMSFADIARHFLDCDEWLFRKMQKPALNTITGAPGAGATTSRNEFLESLEALERSGEKRAKMISGLSDTDLSRRLFDDRFDADITIWWLIVRGNLDHEAHHRGQIAVYLHILDSTA
jgi:uncharacterized damage-inducible protein DinB